ncbi:unnamed protein product [Oppiella nova]|uniref:Peptidase S1 domain-containing protein n=1 Tax=Oppiella nova TaxID=334625 RepID=A0A7R9M3U8_9ACAR|nr:unnamed protein product [Oppiella nova]CAG2170236.1 unnamed protein product [Oppiella nova]
MTTLIANSFQYYWRDVWLESGDQRVVQRLPGFGSGLQTPILAVLIYLVLVLKVIPDRMRHREPLELRYPIMCYNILLVLINGFYFFHELLALDFGRKLIADFKIPPDTEWSPGVHWELKLVYAYYMTKIMDFMDTVFFALRKRHRQITFLHLYHHSVVAVLAWLAIWYRFNMQPLRLFIMLNSFVHTVMYGYYALSAMGKGVQKYLWWKRYITQLQLVQFVVFIAYGVMVELQGVPFPPESYSFKSAESDTCGMRNKNDVVKKKSKIIGAKGFGRIVGGEDAKPHEFPWLVSFQIYLPKRDRIEHFCGGSIISDRWIITAAHCFDKFRKPEDWKKMVVKMGTNQINDTRAFNHTISKVVIHDKWNVSTQSNDIALAMLKQQIIFKTDANQYMINTVCLAEKGHEPTGYFTVAGFGQLGEHESKAENLQKLVVPLYDHKKCTENYKKYVKLSDTNFCAGGQGDHDTCMVWCHLDCPALK